MGWMIPELSFLLHSTKQYRLTNGNLALLYQTVQIFVLWSKSLGKIRERLTEMLKPLGALRG